MGHITFSIGKLHIEVPQDLVEATRARLQGKPVRQVLVATAGIIIAVSLTVTAVLGAYDGVMALKERFEVWPPAGIAQIDLAQGRWAVDKQPGRTVTFKGLSFSDTAIAAGSMQAVPGRPDVYVFHYDGGGRCVMQLDVFKKNNMLLNDQNTHEPSCPNGSLTRIK